MIRPATKLTAITGALHGWAAFQPEWKVYFNSYALQTSTGVILFDPTKPTPAALKHLAGLGEIIAVVLTNAHHDRDSGWFREEFGIQVYAHEHAQPDCDTKIDVLVVDGEKLPGGLRTIFLPGVSDNEMALHTPGLVMIGDAILNTPGKGLELLPDQFIADKKLARQSLQKLLTLDFETVTFGHGEPLVAGGKPVLAQFLKTQQARRR